jgi:hypothetical protein
VGAGGAIVVMLIYYGCHRGANITALAKVGLGAFAGTIYQYHHTSVGSYPPSYICWTPPTRPLPGLDLQQVGAETQGVVGVLLVRMVRLALSAPRRRNCPLDALV